MGTCPCSAPMSTFKVPPHWLAKVAQTGYFLVFSTFEHKDVSQSSCNVLDFCSSCNFAQDGLCLEKKFLLDREIRFGVTILLISPILHPQGGGKKFWHQSMYLSIPYPHTKFERNRRKKIAPPFNSGQFLLKDSQILATMKIERMCEGCIRTYSYTEEGKSRVVS